MLAPAKINLFLHVDRVKPNGRHDLDSLVMFAGAEASDLVEARKAEEISLEIGGPFATPELATPDNLIVRTLSASESRGLRVPPLAISLTKNIPVAAGLGGGSADAGAVLRLMLRFGTLTMPVALTLAATLGGDVPAAVLSKPCLMRGEGEKLVKLQDVPDLPTLLVNPRLPCPTGAVFRAFDEAGGGDGFGLTDMPVFDNAGTLAEWLSAATRNDLEGPALSIVPAIGDVLDEIARQPGCRLSRMSGSGASCFGLFDSRQSLKAAEDALQARHPEWWSVATLLNGASNR